MRWLAASCALVVAVGCRDGREERARAMGSLWIAAARTEACPRPALRSPAGGDATAVLAGLRHGPTATCLAQARELHVERGSEPQKLETFEGHDELRAACAPLYAAIAQVAHATAACSPFDLDQDPRGPDDLMLGLIAVPTAVAVQIAPLVRRGELAIAARHVIDAMRFADDFGRKSSLMGTMLATSAIRMQLAPLLEVLADPRLTSDDARAIAGDLDVLLASGPRFDAVIREETAWLARRVEEMPDVDAVAELDKASERLRAVEQHCCGAMRDCVEQLGAAFPDDIWWADSPRRFATRDFYLSVARMQAELRISGCGATLARWSEHATYRDGAASPPAWQQGSFDRGTRVVLHCDVRRDR